jgi:putative 4-mercaptohistidine N1-methyltranferase
MASSFYETDKALSEYLLFHYGLTKELVPPILREIGALDFPVRCVNECLDQSRIPPNARALDLGCAVGRATFELARLCKNVIGIDFSQSFITASEYLNAHGSISFECVEEGELTLKYRASVPPDIDRTRVIFETGDAQALRSDLGPFDVVLMANLIDRLRDPRKCLNRLPHLLKCGGQLILISPYTWMVEYTPYENWLGGFTRAGGPVRTLETIKEILAPDFDLANLKDLPFVIREHARKFQFSIAQASVWLRK